MRRLVFVLGLSLVASCSKSSSPSSGDLPDAVTFPPGFMWGTATAAFQVEKGSAHSDWATWVTMPGKIKNGDVPDAHVPDALAHVDDDVKLMKGAGHNAYRFSIDWSRLYPTRAAFDADTPDPAAVAAYDAMLQKLTAAGITPYVTLMHFAMPDYLADATKPKEPQGFERAETEDAFGQFCGRIAARWGSLIDLYATINEPVVVPLGGYVQGSFPPGVVLDAQRAFAYAAGEVRGHAKCYDAVHAHDPKALVGPVVHQRAVEAADPTDPDDVAATEHVRYLNNLWFLNAVVRGDYDADVNGTLDGPTDKKADPALVHRADYIGVNYYTIVRVSAHSGIVIPPPVSAAITPDHIASDRPKTDFVWDIYADGLLTVLMEAKDYGLPLVISENGLADAADANRPRFIAEHLYQAGLAIQRGADVRGYFHWSLYDNFEWANGFCPKFGLYQIDPTTAARVARPSADTYRNFIQSARVSRADIAATAPYTAPQTRCE
jgi:beta-glucosidase/6-phospho-beta-glucosidase/beta-galactosidase